MARPRLTGLSDIYTFFRKNETPIYFVSPMPFNVLGLDQWVNHFEYISFFDSFDGHHPRVFVPKETGPQEFRSMEHVCNYLLAHKEVVDRLRRRKGGKMLLVMFDEETEQLARELGIQIALPKAKLRTRLDSKIVTTQLGNEAGVASVPNVLGKAKTYAQLRALAAKARLGDDLVVQAPYGDSGRTTFFVKNEADWVKAVDKLGDDPIKVMKRINHLPGTVEAVATRHGTLVGPLMTDITGFAELTPYKGGWCGNDISPSIIEPGTQRRIRRMVRAFGDRLYEEGYRGCFCFDFLIDTDNGRVYLGEVNPRISGASPPTNLITSKYGGVPLMLFHLLEFMDVDYEIDLRAIQARWNAFDGWSQLILKQTADQVDLITKAPPSGVWRLDPQSGGVTFLRRSLDWHDVADENEAFYMRVYGNGDYRYHGADMGILIARERMQTDDRKLMARAKLWARGILGQFEGVAPPPVLPVLPPDWTLKKMF